MKRFEQNNIYEVLSPLFAWTKLFGLTSFSLQRDGYRRSFTSLLLSVFFAAFYTVLSVTIIATRSVVNVEGVISKVTNVLDLYISNVNIVVFVLFAAISRNKILLVMDSLHSVDAEFAIFHPAADLKALYKGTNLHLTVVMFVANIYLFASFISDAYLYFEETFTYSAIAALMYMLPKVFSTYVVLQFAYLNLLVKQRFALINAKLRDVMECFDRRGLAIGRVVSVESYRCWSRFPKSYINEKLVETIDQIRLKHFKLCNVAYVLNSAYNVQLLVVVLQVFITLLSHLFMCIRDVMLKDGASLQLLIYTMNIALMSFLQILFLTVSCSSTAVESKKTGKILHTAFPNTKERDLEYELLFFSMQLIHHKVEYSACRMFKIDEGLLLSVLGVLCTYLVIVVQFEFGMQTMLS